MIAGREERRRRRERRRERTGGATKQYTLGPGPCNDSARENYAGKNEAIQ